MIRISCVVYEGFALLDAAGPLAAFEAAEFCGAAGYSVEMLSRHGGLIKSSGGVAVDTQPIDNSIGCDTVLIPGGFSARNTALYEDLIDFIVKRAAMGCRMVSICTGSFVLAAAGVLNGRTAATHWLEAPELARRYPTVRLDANSIYVQSGQVWTSAGMTAGIDLALALIEQDYGVAVAKQVAHILVVDHRRRGTQSQHSALLDHVGTDNRFNEVLAWARGHLSDRLDVEILAERAHLSVRQFTRAFTASIGVSPAKAIERLRLERARAAIEANRGSLENVAKDSGFTTADRMRRAFLRVYGESPQAIRRHVAFGVDKL